MRFGGRSGFFHPGFFLALFMLAAPAPALAFRIFVTNEKGNSVSVIDTDKQQVVETVPVGRRPRGVSISPDGKLLYVCASDDNAINVLDVATMKIVRSLESGPDPERFALNHAGDLLYIANEDNAEVTVVDLAKNLILAQVPVGVEPEGMGLSPNGDLLVATSETTNMAHFIDTRSYRLIDSVLVGKRPRIAVFNRSGTQVWVSSELGGDVSVIDTANHQIIRKITFDVPGLTKEEIQPVGVVLSSDGRKAFVALGYANRVAVVDQQSFAVEKYLLVGVRVWHLAFTPDEKLLYTTNGNSNDVTAIDVAREKVIKSISVGLEPNDLVSSLR